MKNKTPTGGSAELRVKSCVLLAVLSGSLPTSFCSLLTRLFRPWLHVWQHFCLKRHSLPASWGGAGVILVLRGTPGTLKDGWSLYRTLHTVSTRPCSYKW